MSELTSKDIELICREIAKNMCTHPKHKKWLDVAFTQTDSQWHGVVAEVAKQGCPVDEIETLPRGVIRDFVYICIKAPNVKKTGEVLVLFKLADSIWSQIISSTPPSARLESTG